MKSLERAICCLVVLAGCLAGSSEFARAGYVQAVKADNPISYWRFDDPSSNNGDTATDQRGNNHGVYGPGVTLSAPGGGAPIHHDPNNKAAGFSSGYVDVGTLPGFGANMATGVTVEM